MRPALNDKAQPDDQKDEKSGWHWKVNL